MAASIPTSLQEFVQTTVVRLAPGRQRYHIQVPGTASAAFLSVVSFEAVEKLNRSDYLGRPSSCHITSPRLEMLPCEVSAERIFSGCITQFNKVGRTADFYQYEVISEPLLRRHDLDGNQFLVKMHRAYSVRAARHQIFDCAEACEIDPQYCHDYQRPHQLHLQGAHPEQEQAS